MSYIACRALAVVVGALLISACASHGGDTDPPGDGTGSPPSAGAAGKRAPGNATAGAPSGSASSAKSSPGGSTGNDPATASSGSDNPGVTTSAPTSSLGSILFYEQAPLTMSLGQAVSATRDDNSGWSQANLLPSCISFTTHSTLDTMRELGSSGLGDTVMSTTGAPLGDGTVGLADGPGAAGYGWTVPDTTPASGAVTPGLLSPWVGLDQITAFRNAAAWSPTRVSGVGEILVKHNAFGVESPQWTAKSDACGSFFVRGLSTMRFLSYAFTIDFPTSDAARGFDSQFHTVNAIFTNPSAVASLLAATGAQLTAHVLVPTTLSALVKAKVAGDGCDAAHIDACRTLDQHLADLLLNLPTIPGSDETLDQVHAPDSTWGIYGVAFGENTMLP